MRRGISKAVSAMVAAALACPMVPASALAADGQSGQDVCSASARSQLSVTVPAFLDFSQGGELVIQQKDSWPTLSVPVSIENSSGDDLYISAVDVKQTAGSSSLANLYQSGAVSIAIKPSSASAEISGQVGVGSASTALSMPEDAEESLLIPKASKTELTLSMDKGSATYRSDEDLKAASEKGALQLMSLAWTFAAAIPAFSLKVADVQVGQAPGERPIPTSMLGKSFNLAQVKAHSKALADGTADQDVQDLYRALVTSMAPEGDYACTVKYAGMVWPVRIIGLRQDVAAGAHGQYENGDTVGLTFQFRDLIGRIPFQTDATSNSGGWGGSNAKELRDKLQAGGELYEGIAIKDSIVPVRKYYSSTCASGSGNVTYVPGGDRMFLASFMELTGNKKADGTAVYNQSSSSGYPWVQKEGAGRNHDEQYLFYQNKGIRGNNTNYEWLAKTSGPDWEFSKVESPNSLNTSKKGIFWWMRFASPGNERYFMAINSNGYGNTGFIPLRICAVSARASAYEVWRMDISDGLPCPLRRSERRKVRNRGIYGRSA